MLYQLSYARKCEAETRQMKEFLRLPSITPNAARICLSGGAPIWHMRGVRPKAARSSILAKTAYFFHRSPKSPLPSILSSSSIGILAATMVHRGNTREPKGLRGVRISTIEDKWRRHKNKRRIWQRYMKKIALSQQAV